MIKMLIVKKPTVADSEGIRAIFLEYQIEAFFNNLPPALRRMTYGMNMNDLMKDMANFSHDDILDSCIDDFLAERNRCVVMEKDGKIIGYCLASVEIVNHFGTIKRIIGIGEIYINKTYRYKGFGSKLLIAFIKSMNKNEECSIATVLNEQKYNPSIANFFEKNGFMLEKLGYKLKLGKKEYKVDYTIRDAVPGDYEGYKKLVISMYESFKNFDANIYNGVEVVYSEGFYLQELREPDTHHFVCEIDNDIAGICMVQEDEDDISIHTVSVADKYAKRGIATSLYHSAFNFAMENGYSEISAVVFAQNNAARKFHEHMKMRPVTHRYKYQGGLRPTTQ